MAQRGGYRAVSPDFYPAIPDFYPVIPDFYPVIPDFAGMTGANPERRRIEFSVNLPL